MSRLYDLRDSFYAKRRAYIDEVLFDTSLKPLPRLFGLAVAQCCNRDNSDTFTDTSTIATRLGVKRDDCVKASSTLEKAGRLKITRKGAKDQTSRGRIHLEPRLKHDARCRSNCGSKQYYKERAEWFEPVLFDTELSPAHRLVAMCVAAFTNPETGWCVEGHSAIARMLGLHRSTVIAAIKEIECQHHIETGSAPGIGSGQLLVRRMLTRLHLSEAVSDHLSQRVSEQVSDVQGKSGEKLITYKAISGNTGIFGNTGNTLTSPGRRGVCDVEFLDRWRELCEFLNGDYAKEGGRQTYGGIIYLSSANTEVFISDAFFRADELNDYVALGWFRHETYDGTPDSDGKWLRITAAGHEAWQKADPLRSAA